MVAKHTTPGEDRYGESHRLRTRGGRPVVTKISSTPDISTFAGPALPGAKEGDVYTNGSLLIEFVSQTDMFVWVWYLYDNGKRMNKGRLMAEKVRGKYTKR